MELRLERAHNLFGSCGTAGERAKPNSKYHNQIVNGCLKKLDKSGIATCYYEEQLHDIVEKFDGELEFEYLKDEILIKVR